MRLLRGVGTIRTIKLTVKELRALESILWASACYSGCVYPEMETSKIDCIDCDFTKSISGIINKLENPLNK